ncbi:hypothetical protein [Actinokineospora globicatena]|uniref:hypothetical protein n=1 Tax=Actinokineospora globicatena TaxID=103729 RepID=UPI0020A4D0B6|nr:hypothetical protein [Actinokineospora globicatena]MCP2304010.1 hypothetical protein [Actinokineospora globicatena]
MADLVARARDVARAGDRGLERIERLAIHRPPDDVVRDGAGRPIEDLEVSGGAGRFDLVYARYGRNGEVVGYVLVETKGPEADLGVRLGLDGKHYYQGHPEYVRSLLHDMKQDRYFGNLAREISAKFDQGRVDYILVQAKVAARVKPPDVPLTAARLREANRLARNELRPGETYHERLAQEVDGVHIYAGYKARQFDLGYDPVFNLSELK